MDRRGLGLRLQGHASTRRRCSRCATSTAPARSWTESSTRAPASSCCPPVRRTDAPPATRTSTPSGPASTRRKAVVCYHISEFHYQDQRRLALGLGAGAAVPVLRLAVAEHIRRTPDHRHAVGLDLRQPLRSLSRTSRFWSASSVRSGCHTSSGTWTRAEAWDATARWLGGQLSERPSTIFKKHVRVVPYPEDDTVGHDRTARLHRDTAHGLGLAARRGTPRTSRVLPSGWRISATRPDGSSCVRTA